MSISRSSDHRRRPHAAMVTTDLVAVAVRANARRTVLDSAIKALRTVGLIDLWWFEERRLGLTVEDPKRNV